MWSSQYQVFPPRHPLSQIQRRKLKRWFASLAKPASSLPGCVETVMVQRQGHQQIYNCSQLDLLMKTLKEYQAMRSKLGTITSLVRTFRSNYPMLVLIIEDVSWTSLYCTPFHARRVAFTNKNLLIIQFLSKPDTSTYGFVSRGLYYSKGDRFQLICSPKALEHAPTITFIIVMSPESNSWIWTDVPTHNEPGQLLVSILAPIWRGVTSSDILAWPHGIPWNCNATQFCNTIQHHLFSFF